MRAYVGAAAAANLLVEEPDAVTYRTAGPLPGPRLWSLDALRVAAAVHGDCRTMVPYDLRQSLAPRAAGLQVASPVA